METRSNSSCNRMLPCQVISLGLGIMMLIVIGCGKSGPTMAPAKGRLTLDGQPVADAAVAFMPISGGPMATGNTNAEGVFELQTTNKPGAVLGEHRVTVMKIREFGYNQDGTIGPGGIKTQWLLPKKYSLADSSGLTATVGKDDGEHVLNLSSR